MPLAAQRKTLRVHYKDAVEAALADLARHPLTSSSSSSDPITPTVDAVLRYEDALERHLVAAELPQLEREAVRGESRHPKGDATTKADAGQSSSSNSRATYLDHAGAAPVPRSLVEAHLSGLATTLLGNPHSHHDHTASRETGDAIDAARAAVCKHFNVSLRDYAVVFTSGCTGALKLVADCLLTLPLAPNAAPSSVVSEFSYLCDNHTSVLGMRAPAAASGRTVRCIRPDELVSTATAPALNQTSSPSDSARNTLFVYPVQSNFSGEKYPLDWINQLQSAQLQFCPTPATQHNPAQERQPFANTIVCIDASSMAATAAIDLSEHPADLVALSFYKLFGYPTGLGALLVRRTSRVVPLMTKSYFGGGTVEAASATDPFHAPRRDLSARLEDGTLNFQAIAALPLGFAWLDAMARHGQQAAASDQLTSHALRLAVTSGDVSSFRAMHLIALHTHALAVVLARHLEALRSRNGAPVCCLYLGLQTPGEQPHPLRFDSHGAIVTFNVLRADGSTVGYREFEKLAAVRGIHLRGGCFCNPGACQSFLHLTTDDIVRNYKDGHVCWDDRDIIHGQATGAIRASFGATTRLSDIATLLQFVCEMYASDEATFTVPRSLSVTSSTWRDAFILKSIVVFPIKSCGGMSVESWPIGPSGLLFDREWMIVTPTDVCLNQKREPRLALVTPRIDRANSTFSLSATGVQDLVVPLAAMLGDDNSTIQASWCETVVCGDSVSGVVCGEIVNSWLSRFLARPVRLLRCSAANGNRKCTLPIPPTLLQDADATADKPPQVTNAALSLANESPFLLVSEYSMEAVNGWIGERVGGMNDSVFDTKPHVPIDRFRANFVIGPPSTMLAGEVESDVASSLAFVEDHAQSFAIGGTRFVACGPCTRCQMICVDQAKGVVTSEPLETLARFRKHQGRILFGVHLMCDQPDIAQSSSLVELCVDDPVLLTV
ncbi:molybdenum cofactor sulfurase [Capsaspora owczarzaki ATCC 30864]|uniref:Molybdenum cofactor sulfurase n=1 Tax=Capsaspora owczarzaki (strain ATCC 30864) TaxID=595528 RepID=A0A0D2X3Y3_CAPO3|nr:molybdenum cofactor sulfurase [Capsaspora owczarzaki ATCC 30864]KJE95109.1 molybdenum cofactor sulfurase [Capsaspora owczarzaki ATCC 30864]|eukprot:XP_004346271.1 molybdenum cofactor sulfurase [Capsaspora owczarzaki ATCC 30864]